jgi:hypothetical protein
MFGRAMDLVAAVTTLMSRPDLVIPIFLGIAQFEYCERTYLLQNKFTYIIAASVRT